MEYLVETYDKENKLTIPSFPEKYHIKQYLHFQMSGQGPYYGQTAWYRLLSPEDVPSAKKRYDEQLVRVVEVLDGILKDKTYLVGEKWSVPVSKAHHFQKNKHNQLNSLMAMGTDTQK